MAGIDRRIRARIRGCQDTTFLEGVLCTNACEFRDSCKIKRKPLLVNTLKASVQFDKSNVDGGIYISEFLVTDISADGFINEMFECSEEK